MNMLKTLLGSRTKAKIITLIFENPNNSYYMRLVERLVGERINAVRSALLALVREGVCTREKVGKKTFFKANPKYLYYDELLRIVAKQTGLGGRIIKERLRLGKISLAFITSNYYRHLPRAEDEVDLFIVGTVSLAEVAKIAKEEGDARGSEINYSIMTPEEFRFRKKNKDPFLQKILQNNRLVLIGKEEIFL